MKTISIDPVYIPEEIFAQQDARESHVEFIKYCWQKNDPFLVGFHTEMIGARLDRAFDDFENGISSYLAISVPYRHGKSDLVSRYGPPHFLGRFPQCEVISTAYSTELTNKFSRDARNILKLDSFAELYPDVKPSKEAFNVKEWWLDNGVGRTLWTGISGGMTGNGAHLGIVDDPFKGREEAESERIREKRWEAFTNDFFTRLAPVHVVLLVATSWHPQDFFGKIKKEMADNPNFPPFEFVTFPARSELYTGEGEYSGRYLFEERYSPEWYEKQYNMLGSYAAAALLDCAPQDRIGSTLKVEEGVNWHYVDEKPPGFGRIGRAWDLASSEKQTKKDDPDWTVGVKGAVKTKVVQAKNDAGLTVPLKTVDVYIEDIVRVRAEAPQRNQLIVRTANNDGRSVPVFVEAFAAYKDAYTTLANVLDGVAIVRKSQLPGDKVTKAANTIEVPLEYGRVYINSKIDRETLQSFLDTLKSFPNGAHDDDVDAVAVLIAELTKSANFY